MCSSRPYSTQNLSETEGPESAELEPKSRLTLRPLRTESSDSRIGIAKELISWDSVEGVLDAGGGLAVVPKDGLLRVEGLVEVVAVLDVRRERLLVVRMSGSGLARGPGRQRGVDARNREPGEEEGSGLDGASETDLHVETDERRRGREETGGGSRCPFRKERALRVDRDLRLIVASKDRDPNSMTLVGSAGERNHAGHLLGPTRGDHFTTATRLETFNSALSEQGMSTSCSSSHRRSATGGRMQEASAILALVLEAGA